MGVVITEYTKKSPNTTKVMNILTGDVFKYNDALWVVVDKDFNNGRVRAMCLTSNADYVFGNFEGFARDVNVIDVNIKITLEEVEIDGPH